MTSNHILNDNTSLIMYTINQNVQRIINTKATDVTLYLDCSTLYHFLSNKLVSQSKGCHVNQMLQSSQSPTRFNAIKHRDCGPTWSTVSASNQQIHYWVKMVFHAILPQTCVILILCNSTVLSFVWPMLGSSGSEGTAVVLGSDGSMFYSRLLAMSL